MDKRVLSLILAGVLSIGSIGVTAYADGNIKEVNEINKEEENLIIENKDIDIKTDYEVKVNIPEIKGLSNKKYEEKINNSIKNDFEKVLKEFEEEAKNRENDNSELFIDYEVKANDGVLSIIVNNYRYFAGDANGESKSEYYNIDIKNNRNIGLDEFFKEDIDYKEIINKEIKNQISVRDDDLLEGEDGFKSIKEDQNFYIDEYGNLVIVFEEYEIGPKSVGKPEFIISLDSIIDEIRPEMIVKPLVLGKVIEINMEDEARAVVPQVKGLGDLKIEQEINKSMNDLVVGEVNEFKKEVKEYKTEGNAEFEISYDVENYRDIISIKIESYKLLPGMAHPENNIYYFNLDINENKILKVKDLFKTDIKYSDFINKEINSRINMDKDNYFQGEDGFNGIKEDQKFHIDNSGNLVIEFDKYEIAPGSTGNPRFKISGYKLKDLLKEEYAQYALKSLDKVIINGAEIKLDNPMYLSNDDTIMIPLVEIAKKLDFKVEWDGKTGRAMLIHDKTKVVIGTKENEYIFNDSLIVLENGAEIKNGHVYIPQNFIDDVLYGRLSIVNGLMNISY